MAINKVVYGNDTLIDLTEDTATADDVLNGKTFHLKNGVRATGNASIGIDMDLLWTNASPTSDFVGQSISINLSGYTMALIVTKWAKNDAKYIYHLLLVNTLQNCLLGHNPSNTGVGGGRVIQYNTVGSLAIGDAYSGTSKANNVLVPYQIYGIK